jgi:hypothetical protein
MGWFLDKFKNSLFNTGDPAIRGGNQSSNTAGDATGRVLDPFTTGKFYIGKVVRAGAGTYDVSVRTPGSTQLACMLGSSTVNYYFGVSDCTIPIEGSRVVVYHPYSNARYGIVVCVLPSADLGSPLSEAGKPPEAHVGAIDLEPSASSATEAAYTTPQADPKNMESINSHAGRPHDFFPGNKVWINEQGVGLAILNLLTGLRASDKAKIELGVLDDMVRMVSGHYRHNTSQGEHQIYNDEGRLTQEWFGTSYQEERSGHTTIGPPNFTDTGNKKILASSKTARAELIDEALYSKKRFQIFTGYLGDIVNFFVANPDPETEMETQTADTMDQGLMHTHIDASGRLLIRSAAGMSIERWDRLPIPKKRYEPWDPEGDKDLEDPKEKLPFDFDEAHPYGRSLQLRDAMAWRNKQAYQRIHDQSASAGMKDYYLPEESEMDTPQDEYDLPGQGEEKFQENAGRRAYFNVEDDGSIVFRDAWGSEILLRGGNIILNCAGQIEVRSGKSIVQLAGHDIITKAMKSVDITARDRDVRVKANVNLHMLSEGRAGDDSPSGGGILLESKSDGDTGTHGFSREGEQVLSKGIMLKAKDSTVYLQGKTVHATCEKSIILEGKSPNGGEAVGELWIACKSLLANATRTIGLTTDSASGVLITRSSSIVYGRSALLVGGNSVAILRDSKAWIPLTEVDIGSDPYTQLAGFSETMHETFQTDDDWLEPFKPENRDDIEFTYRSSEEYGTNKGTEVYKGSKFYVYRPMWAQMLSAGHELIEETLETWTEYPIEDTYAWPGKEQYDGTPYVKMSDEVNLLDPATEIPKKRSELRNKSGTFNETSFHEYEVVKT